MRFSRCLALLALCFTVACAGGEPVRMTTIRHSADYQTVLRQDDLALLPVEVVVNTVNVAGNQERAINYEYHLEDVLRREVASALAAKGYHVMIVRRKELHAAKLSHALVDVRAAYVPLQKKLYASLYMNEKQAFALRETLGDKAALIGQKTSSPVLVLVDYTGSMKTNGARAKDFAMDVLLGTRRSANVEGATLVIGLVEAQTGRIVWSHIGSDSKGIYSSALDNFSSQDEVEQHNIRMLVDKVLQPLPLR